MRPAAEGDSAWEARSEVYGKYVESLPKIMLMIIKGLSCINGALSSAGSFPQTISLIINPFRRFHTFCRPAKALKVNGLITGFGGDFRFRGFIFPSKLKLCY